MSLMIYSYNNNSKSARALAEELGVKLIKHENSDYKPSAEKYIINWGSGAMPRSLEVSHVFNKSANIRSAINKIKAFEKFKANGVSTVPWTTSRAAAEKWAEDGHTVVCRNRVEGYDGAGILLIAPEDYEPEIGLPGVPLYTWFVPDTTEYRITVAFGEVVTRQKKVRIKGKPEHEYNDRIRTTAGNYGFDLVDLVPNTGIVPNSIKAVQALGLDFGGVDILSDGVKSYVLEVNTAPVLTPVAAKKMAEKFKRFV